MNLLRLSQVLQRILNARQFGLKLIANVTYGYTAAGFSGRMPCAELADSIVQVSSWPSPYHHSSCEHRQLQLVALYRVRRGAAAFYE